jgi:2,3-bisphosphoglycerate-independent phosphoglycerate mutase
MKKIILSLQGLTDVPSGALGGKTPLEKAITPALDLFASKAWTYTLKAPACQQLALLSLMGIETKDEIPVGPLAAHALGYCLRTSQVAYIVDFVSIGQGVVVDVAETLASAHESQKLCDALNKAAGSKGFHFFHLQENQAVMITDDADFSKAASSCPLKNSAQALNRAWLDTLPSLLKSNTPRLLIKNMIQTIEDHEINKLREDMEESPINGLLFREGGGAPSWGPESSNYPLKDWGLFSESPASLGIAKTAGMQNYPWPFETQAFAGIKQILQLLPQYLETLDTIIIEVPYLRRATLLRDLLKKVKTIEWLDRNAFAPLAQYADEESIALAFAPLTHSNVQEGRMLEGLVPSLIYHPKLPSSSPAISDQNLNSNENSLELSLFARLMD